MRAPARCRRCHRLKPGLSGCQVRAGGRRNPVRHRASTVTLCRGARSSGFSMFFERGLSRLLDASPCCGHDEGMRAYILFAITILATVGMGLVNVHPKEADSNAAAWLDLVGLSSWGEGFTAATDKQITIGISVVLAVCVVAMTILTVRWVKHKCIVTKVPDWFVPWRQNWNAFPSLVSRLPRDLIPLIDGIEMAWSKLRHDVIMLQKEDVESYVVHRFLVDEMLGGDRSDVTLYAVRPLFNTPDMINHPTDYVFSDNGKTAVHVRDERERLTNLQVRRRDVKRWVKNYLRRIDEEIQQNEEASTDG